jgi:hypothetical protein
MKEFSVETVKFVYQNLFLLFFWLQKRQTTDKYIVFLALDKADWAWKRLPH